jgi:hypothetical protein
MNGSTGWIQLDRPTILYTSFAVRLTKLPKPPSGLKIGDKIRVIGVPPNTPEMNTRSAFQAALGHVFPIRGFLQGEIELWIGHLTSAKKRYMESIWIEPELVEFVARPRRKNKT